MGDRSGRVPGLDEPKQQASGSARNAASGNREESNPGRHSASDSGLTVHTHACAHTHVNTHVPIHNHVHMPNNHGWKGKEKEGRKDKQDPEWLRHL